MLKIIQNPDRQKYEEVSAAVKANDGYCPCLIVRNENTKCPCKSFRDEPEPCTCHCGRYVKIKE